MLISCWQTGGMPDMEWNIIDILMRIFAGAIMLYGGMVLWKEADDEWRH